MVVGLVIVFTFARPRDRWVHLGSLCALGVDGFIWGSCVQSRSLWGSSDSSGIARPGFCWVHSVSLDSIVLALWGFGFRWGGWVHSRVPYESLGSSGVVGCTRVLAGGRWVYSRPPLGSLGSSGVVAFNRALSGGRWVYLGHLGSFARALGVFWFIRCHSRSPWGSISSSGSLGSFACAGVFRFTVPRPGSCWVHPASLISLACALAVVGFIRGRALGVFGFIGGRCVNSRALSVIAFILGCWVHSRAPWGSLSSSWLIEFTRVRCRCCSVPSQSLGSLAHSLVVITARSVHWRFL